VLKTNTLGDFRLLARLGEGGMGTVFKARQISTGRDVALKVLSKELAGRPGFVERFHREGRLMLRLEHPHVLRCHAVGTSHGFHFLAMELVTGGSLGDWLKKLGRFRAPDALHAVRACGLALQFAHEQGMVHRDVKPDNLLLTGDGVVKLADLGLAKASNDDLGLTATGMVLGTPLYAAPEQVHNARQADARSDVYSLGCVLYHFLTGRLPFEANNFLDLMKVKEKGTFTPARRWSPEVPKKLDRVLTRMLARLPERRYPTCAELLQDLDCLGLAGARLSFLAT
jgi:serine/threonine-protein kinase